MDIDSPYTLTEDQISEFRRRGFIKLKSVLQPEVLVYYGEEFGRRVAEKQMLPMSERSTFQKAFVQVLNLWVKSDVVKEFVFGKRLARIAAELMGTRGVRIYHDQALYKEPGGGLTPWHADQYYWPFATEKCCSVWIPLQDTSLEMGPLAFAEGSHTFEYGRDLTISDESEEKIAKALTEADLAYAEKAFDLGEVSYHYGWTFHRAAGNRTERPREAMVIVYMDIDMRMSEETNPHQQAEIWCPGVKVGGIIDTAQTPVVWEGG